MYCFEILMWGRQERRSPEAFGNPVKEVERVRVPWHFVVADGTGIFVHFEKLFETWRRIYWQYHSIELELRMDDL